MYRVSSDNGKTWTKDALFPMDTAGWLPRNLPITLPGGELLVPLSDERNERRQIVLRQDQRQRANLGALGNYSEYE